MAANEIDKSDQHRAGMLALGVRARAAATVLAASSAADRASVIEAIAAGLEADADAILAANRDDMQKARARGLSEAMLDRLLLDGARVQAMADALRVIAALDEPIGKVLDTWQQPNGLKFSRVSVPLGVIGIVYESRPNVTADAAAICLKAANAVILRGGSESAASARQIVQIVRAALERCGLPVDAVQMVPSQDRALVGDLLSGLDGSVDVVVPRGGRALIERVQRDARVPVIGHLEGLCHVYVHASAAPQMAIDIAVNAKLRRTGICGAMETLLLDAALPDAVAKGVIEALLKGGCALRGCARAQALHPSIGEATEADWRTEYLDRILSVKVVDDVSDALAHIRRYGSGHTESVVAEDEAIAARFLNELDSAIVMHNASTQFADGGEFGMGAEIGISTSRIHARGPVGAAQLTSYKYIVRGDGQIRDV